MFAYNAANGTDRSFEVTRFERTCRVDGLVIFGTNEAQLPSPYSCEILVTMFAFLMPEVF